MPGLEQAAASLSKARRALKTAVALNATRFADPVVEQSVVAMRHAAQALLLAETDEAPSKTTAIIARFSGHLINAHGRKNSDLYGAAFNHAYNIRNKVEYDVKAKPTLVQARQIRNDAQALVRFCELAVREARRKRPRLPKL
jgi:uncharacterized protein (UPF0332 family)